MTTVRTLALALAVGLVAGGGFWGANAFANHQFADVATANAFHGDIGWLTTHGIASGFPNGTFRPTDAVNRQQASRWLRNYNDGYTVVETFDNPPASSAHDWTTDCPEGSQPLAGGGSTTSNDLFITDSSSTATGWTVAWESDNNASVNPDLVAVEVLCGPDDSTSG